jgi:hypothetical protein
MIAHNPSAQREIMRLIDAGVRLIKPRDVGLRRSLGGVQGSTVLLVAVKTAVTWWQPGARRGERYGSPRHPASVHPKWPQRLSWDECSVEAEQRSRWRNQGCWPMVGIVLRLRLYPAVHSQLCPIPAPARGLARRGTAGRNAV